MIKNLISFLKMIAAILPFAVLCLSSVKVNYDKADRSKQYFMPVVTLVYVAVTMIFMNQINSGLLKLINNTTNYK